MADFQGNQKNPDHDANAAFTVGAGPAIGEVLVWRAVLTDAQWDALNAEYLVLRWGLAIPRPATAQSGSLSLPVAASLPTGVATPVCWLNAAAPATLYADTAGTLVASADGPVRRWADLSGQNHHLTIAAGGAVWPSTVRVNQNPVVGIALPAGFTSSPLTTITGAGGYTIVAVWQATAGGGHPFNASGLSAFGLTAWAEAIETDGLAAVTMPTPQSCGVAAGQTLAVCWMRNGTTVSVMLAASGGAGYHWTKTATAATGWLGVSGYPTVGGGVPLAELLVWNAPLDATALAAVARWNVPGVTRNRRPMPAIIW